MEMIEDLKPFAALKNLGIKNPNIHYQLSADVLTEQSLVRQQGEISSSGALCINTGKFTGRSPKDKFIVKDADSKRFVDWNKTNIPIDEAYFVKLHHKLTAYLSELPEIWVRDCYACADPDYRICVRVVNENPWSNLFVENMFLRPTVAELENFVPDWFVLQAPSFLADPFEDGTRSPHFALISFTHKTILIGGTGYTGEIKKGIFTILNYLLPVQENVLSMHCAANVGRNGDTALFFGLSGTGKTTLSADPTRQLVGDDEHGWSEKGIFNFEGGCYAKCIDLTPAKEPQIFDAIRPGALVENVSFKNGSNVIDFHSRAITENTRVSYPLHFIDNALEGFIAEHPRNIFFLTCDANGVLPPISKLTPAQAMYHFISGYTAKIPGTETGVQEPKSTFSACFGAPFMPLHPGKYAEMLGEKIRKHNANVWLVNTGWIGGAYGTGSRISLKHTRQLIAEALNGNLLEEEYITDEFFGLHIPVHCIGVPAEMLHPRNTWADKKAYDLKAQELAKEFSDNFLLFATFLPEEIKTASPNV